MIEMQDVHKIYRMGKTRVHALAGVDLQVAAGEMLAIMGPSGSGKSTLMNIMGCLDRPTRGAYTLEGEAVAELDNNALARIRGERIGFVFQTFNLLPRTPALQNVMLPLMYQHGRDRRRLAEEALARVGMADRMDHRPSELSGGQQQRVAVARALVTEPAIILADEPTGNLDSRTSREIMQLFRDLNDEGVTVVLVTHDQEIGDCAKRIVRMRDGRIVTDGPAPHMHPQEMSAGAEESVAAAEAKGSLTPSGSSPPTSSVSS
ncbi:MAG: ABC transporter ATP-binding protein [Armatimonadetes bacterium]|nr:ABC transporter ATP-binding protein [Armatimonadota bacterium]